MITSSDIFNNFNMTMTGLEKGLQVIHLTTPTEQLRCCQQDDDIEAVLVRPDIKQFDRIPVKEQTTIIGILKRRECPENATGSVRNHMQRLGEETLVSADTSLLEFIQADSLDRIVINGTKIYGLVTRSDLLKLPVYLLGFGLITHIEALMLAIIRSTNVSEGEWLKWIDPNNKKTLERLFAKLVTERLELEMLELTYFSDKKTILNKLSTSKKYASYLPPKELISHLVELKELRNSIAHSGSASEENNILQKFIVRLRMAYTWIQKIEKWQTEMLPSSIKDL